MTDKVAKLVIGDQTHEFPVLSGSVGPDVIDIRSLYAKTGMFTYDPGFTSTAACDSAITYIDGDKGQLLYRGYPIEQLSEKSSYIEVCYLLLYGELPNKAQLDEFSELSQLRLVGQLAIEQQVADLGITALLGKLLDGVAAVQQLPLVPVDIGDGAVARRRRGEARIVGEHAGLGIERSDVDHVWAYRAGQDWKFVGLVPDDEFGDFFGH